MVKKATKAKVAVYTCGLDISQTETKGTVLLKKADELLDFTRGEEKQLEGVSTPSYSIPSPSFFARADGLIITLSVLQGDRKLWRQTHHRWLWHR